MRNTVLYIFLILLLVGCHSSGERVLSSPDKRLKISSAEFHGVSTGPGVQEWINVFRFKSNGRWQKDFSQSLSFEYYCTDSNRKSFYDELHRDEYCEWEPGFLPIRIDLFALSDGTPIYLVYALTYADTAFHDYYYAYTALCIKDGKIWKYPIFEGMDSKKPDSEIVIINPASIDLDFTIHPSEYEFEQDDNIARADEKDRIAFDSNTGVITIANCFSFFPSNNTYSFINN